MVNSNPEKSKVEGILLISDFAASWGWEFAGVIPQ